MEGYKVLITTSGLGSRLGNLTKFTNKALVRIGKKPALSYIIESYPEEIELVITVGYFADHIRQFVSLAYPNRKITFVDVERYEGEGSSLAYSILQAKDHLQCPFVFNASDSIVKKDSVEPWTDWLGVSKQGDCSQYRTVSGNKINEKGDMESDWAYIGIAGINSYEKFWASLENVVIGSADTSLSDCHAINDMNQSWIKIICNDWLDTGNSSSLKRARESVEDKFHLLDKEDESIFLFEDFVIKFFADETMCANRVERCKSLTGTPKLLGSTKNFYKYEYAKGELLSDCVNDYIFDDLLEWAGRNLWVRKTESDQFEQRCKEFYFDKTFERLKKFREKSGIPYSKVVINGYTVLSVENILHQISKKWFCSGIPVQFHGDFILDNILYNEDKFTLLDWRQDFGGSTTEGDIYYDLAKLNHNLVFNHEVVFNRGFKVVKNGDTIHLDILRSERLRSCQEILHTWIKKNGLDLIKVNVLTAIIWLNMAPLHDAEMGEFLYYFGALHLEKYYGEICYQNYSLGQ